MMSEEERIYNGEHEHLHAFYPYWRSYPDDVKPSLIKRIINYFKPKNKNK